jgi:hypothetical protein
MNNKKYLTVVFEYENGTKLIHDLTGAFKDGIPMRFIICLEWPSVRNKLWK